MTRDGLVNAFRLRVADTTDPPLWTDDECLEFLDDAENEAAERASLLRDTTTAEVCQVAVVAGTASYLLDARILRVERAKLDRSATPLWLSSTAAMDRGGATPRDWRTQSLGWQTYTSGGWERRTGTPSTGLLDREGARWKLTLVPKPVANDTLRLQVVRLPLTPLSAGNGNAKPEIDARLHVRLIDWMVHRAHSKQDAETAERTKAAEAEAAFTRTFGERIDANARRQQHDRAPCVTTFQEF